jgi:hypothetical protein
MQDTTLHAEWLWLQVNAELVRTGNLNLAKDCVLAMVDLRYEWAAASGFVEAVRLKQAKVGSGNPGIRDI